MTKKDYIPINKGHFELDTEERIREFQKKMAVGWDDLEEYKEYRRSWEELPKTKTVRDYPLLVDFELSSLCNLKCPMCYTITAQFKEKVKTGLMDMDLYRRLIDEVAGKVYAIRLSFRGEPTLHKQFVEAISYAREKGIREISFLTNGSTLKLDNFIRIAKAGADWITVSIDGLGEEYEKIRRPLKFEDTLNKLKAIYKYKQENGLVKPVIKVQGIWPAIRPNPSEYYNTIAPYVDLIAFNPLIDYLRKDSEIVYEEGFCCPQLYQRLVVGSDGRVLLCSNDEDGDVILGDTMTQTIHDIWHGETISKVRKVHAQEDGFKEYQPCRICYYPRKAVPDEKATVNGREIWVENYVNRQQEVGS